MTSSSTGRVGHARLRRTLAASLALAPVLAAPSAIAQSTEAPPLPARLETVVITASRTPQPLSSVLADVSVIDRETIERSGAVGVADLLARLPGIELARNGGPGAVTGLFIRGNESRHTALYIDGVRIDSQATGGALWEQIPLDQIERIEVLRGPAAAVYGSDAVAGAVQLFTRRGEGAARATGSLRIGSHDTTQVEAGLSGASGAVDYALSGSRARSRGFDASTTPGSDPDDDGWDRSAFHARIGLRLDPRHRVEAALLSTRLNSRNDGFTPGVDEANVLSLRTAHLAWQARWNEDASTRVQLGRTVGRYATRPDDYRTETTLRDLTLQHEQRLGRHRLNATLERREDALLNPATAFSPMLAGRRHQDAIGLGWGGDFGPHQLQLHLRRDDDSEFGAKGTGSLAWGWRFVPQWRLTASAGTAFRAPTLYQRYSPYGNPALVPESGRNVEAGLRWQGERAEASLLAWRNRVSQLIAFGSPGPCADAFGCYVNVGQAELRGVTLAGQARFDGLALQASLGWHDPRNVATGRLLQRRARRLATLGAEQRIAGWTVGAEVQAAGARWEDAANTQRLGGYAVVNLQASRVLLPGMALELRIDNLADRDHELALGYANGGRNAQLALRWSTP